MATDRAHPANPELLRWARERSGLTVEAVADRMGKSPEVIRSWESGDSAPTFLQLERLATSFYQRPVALFFFPTPPDEEPLEHEFRTLPETELDAIPPSVRLELRRAKTFLLSLRELTGNHNPADRLIWRDLDVNVGSSIEEAGAQVRDYLGVSMATQRRWTSSREAMSAWRQAVETVGVYVFKHPFGTDEVSGFCLYDPEFPIVMINNGSTFTRQIFTLFHELSHILLGLSGLTPDDLTYAERIESDLGRQIEMTCNALSAEILVPRATFPIDRLAHADDLMQAVTDVAASYSVSREVVLRRLLDADVVDRQTYLRWTEEWSTQRTYRSGSGGSFYNNQRAYLGDAYLNLAFSYYDAGLLSLADLADHLRMRAETAQKFETVLATRG